VFFESDLEKRPPSLPTRIFELPALSGNSQLRKVAPLSSAMSQADFRWKRLIRFRDETGTVRYGEPQLEESQDLLELWKADHSIPITAYKSTNPFEITNRSETVSASVKEILPILESNDVPVIKCIGLNYMKHSTWFDALVALLTSVDGDY
jgi:hypothetical protein